jgi:hypothetical protein
MTTELTPERRADLRVNGPNGLDDDELLALLDAADERDRLVAEATSRKSADENATLRGLLADAAKYEVRAGKNGVIGIFLRAYNVRVAEFSENSHEVQETFYALCNAALAPPPEAKGS